MNPLPHNAFDPDIDPLEERSTNRRLFMAGAAGLGLAGLIGLQSTAAQEIDDDDDPGMDDFDDLDDFGQENVPAEFGEGYQNFIGKLAGGLGVTDSSEIDLAIRSALKAMVDETIDAGEISRNQADSLKQHIDSTPVPLVAPVIVGGIGLRRTIREERRNRDGQEDKAPQETVDATPAF